MEKWLTEKHDMQPIKESMNFQCMIVAVRSATEEVARKAWKIIFESWIFQACLETTARITEIVSIRRLNTWLSCIHIIYMFELPISQLHKPWHISKTSWFNSISVHQLSKSTFQSRKRKKQKRKAMIHKVQIFKRYSTSYPKMTPFLSRLWSHWSAVSYIES